ncbi:hypothetical protein HDV00_012698 [Rhizophlyctis rosea]|nr:hypothetical protein HDV00_012698 [Rhizophlyctis rosea]
MRPFDDLLLEHYPHVPEQPIACLAEIDDSLVIPLPSCCLPRGGGEGGLTVLDPKGRTKRIHRISNIFQSRCRRVTDVMTGRVEKKVERVPRRVPRNVGMVLESVATGEEGRVKIVWKWKRVEADELTEFWWYLIRVFSPGYITMTEEGINVYETNLLEAVEHLEKMETKIEPRRRLKRFEDTKKSDLLWCRELDYLHGRGESSHWEVGGVRADGQFILTDRSPSDFIEGFYHPRPPDAFVPNGFLDTVFEETVPRQISNIVTWRTRYTRTNTLLRRSPVRGSPLVFEDWDTGAPIPYTGTYNWPSSCNRSNIFESVYYIDDGLGIRALHDHSTIYPHDFRTTYAINGEFVAELHQFQHTIVFTLKFTRLSDRQNLFTKLLHTNTYGMSLSLSRFHVFVAEPDCYSICVFSYHGEKLYTLPAFENILSLVDLNVRSVISQYITSMADMDDFMIVPLPTQLFGNFPRVPDGGLTVFDPKRRTKQVFRMCEGERTRQKQVRDSVTGEEKVVAERLAREGGLCDLGRGFWVATKEFETVEVSGMEECREGRARLVWKWREADE